MPRNQLIFREVMPSTRPSVVVTIGQCSIAQIADAWVRASADALVGAANVGVENATVAKPKQRSMLG